jgi:glutaredoxin
MPTMNPLKTNSSAAARPTRLARAAAVALLLGGAAVGALAQYRLVGPDGKVTYTDKPPTAADVRMPQGTPAPAANGGALPYETRTAMGKYPVTLYSTKGCPGCDQARQALKQRGVPFSEYSVVTDADSAAFQARFGGMSLPVILIGSQSLKGYSANNLSGYLDAAGYPAQARLIGYNWPPASPLAPLGTPAPATAAATDEAAAPPAPLLPLPNKNGIQF